MNARLLRMVAGGALALLVQSCGSAPPAPEGTDYAAFSRAMAAYRVADYDTAHAEFLPLAEHGMPAAQFRLGAMYENGRGVARDLDAAKKWYAAAAAQNYPGALYALGYIAQIEHDTQGAIDAWRRAARQGDGAAMFGLGRLYDEGTGVDRDPVAAHMWYDLAAAQGAGGAAEARDALERTMSAAGIAEARARARAWLNGGGEAEI